jgi:hypothetical protein
MTAHTPGPWTYTLGSGIHDANNRRVASLSYAGKPISQAITYEELSANAALIAAAPDLLDILRKVLSATADVAPGHIDRFAHVIYREVQQRGAELLHRIDRST